jgi:hypothetical protein
MGVLESDIAKSHVSAPLLIAETSGVSDERTQRIVLSEGSLHRHELCTKYGREGNCLSRAVVDKLSQRHFEVSDGTDRYISNEEFRAS